MAAFFSTMILAICRWNSGIFSIILSYLSLAVGSHWISCCVTDILYPPYGRFMNRPTLLRACVHAGIRLPLGNVAHEILDAQLDPNVIRRTHDAVNTLRLGIIFTHAPGA